MNQFMYQSILFSIKNYHKLALLIRYLFIKDVQSVNCLTYSTYNCAKEIICRI